MIDKENVIKGLEQFKSDFKPFCGNSADWKRVDDALALLKEQEAVVPQLSINGLWYECPVCHRRLTKDRNNYCARCGRSVKWE